MEVGKLTAVIGADITPLRDAMKEASRILNEASNQISDSAKKASKSWADAGKSMKSAGKSMSLAITAPLVAAGAYSFKIASDYEESLNKVRVAFGNSSKVIEDFSKTTMTSIGLAAGSTLEMASIFGDMATSMGISQGEAAGMSKTLVQLAGDMASFKNVGIDQIQTAFSGIFTGETESLKHLGIVMSETALNTYILSNGIKKQYKEMSQAEKVMTRYQYIMEYTKNSQGDFLRTQGGAANQMRIFSQSIKEASESFGKLLLPVGTAIIKVVNGIIQSIMNLNESMKKMVLVIGLVLAGIGPFLLALGSFLTIWPKIVIGFNAIKASMISMYKWVIANPYTALAAALLAISVAFTAIHKSATLAEQAQKEYATSLNTELGGVTALFDQLKKTNIQTSERAKLVDEIQTKYGAYLGNIDLEVAGLEGIELAQRAVNEALIDHILLQQKAAKIGELAAKQADILLKLNAKGYTMADIQEQMANNSSVWTVQADKGVQNLIAAYYQLTGQISDISKAYDSTASSYRAAFNTNPIVATGNAIKTVVSEEDIRRASLGEIGRLQEDINKAEADYIAANTLADRRRAQLRIAALQDELMWMKAITDLEAKTPSMPTRTGKIEWNESLISDKPEVNTDLRLTETNKFIYEASIGLQTLQETGLAVAQTLGNAFAQMGQSLVNSFNLASTGMEGFVKIMSQGVLKLMGMFLSQAIGAAISGMSLAASFTGPAAIFTLPMYIAEGVGAVMAAFAAIPEFADGGVISGPTIGMMGEYPGAKSNPEVIAPLDRLKKLIGGNDTEDITVQGKLVGADLYLSNQRYNKRKTLIQ